MDGLVMVSLGPPGLDRPLALGAHGQGGLGAGTQHTLLLEFPGSPEPSTVQTEEASATVGHSATAALFAAGHLVPLPAGSHRLHILDLLHVGRLEPDPLVELGP